MKKGSPIDSHKLRVFCHNHGGAVNVAKAVGKNTQTLYNAIKLGRATATTEPKAPETEEKKVSNLPQTKSIVDELLDEMQKTAAGSKTETPKAPDIPKIAVGQNLPKTYGWREKTLAEMTGDDINRMVQSVVSGVLATVVKELLGMTIGVKLGKDGGAYGW